MRRRCFVCAATGAAAVGLLLTIGASRAEPQRPRGSPRRVAITARKFSFSETQVVAHPGESIRFEIESLDFVHGFALPQLGVRVDAPPGKTTTLLLTDLRAGHYTFLCDNFCGDAHDRMTGMLVVA